MAKTKRARKPGTSSVQSGDPTTPPVIRSQERRSRLGDRHACSTRGPTRSTFATGCTSRRSSRSRPSGRSRSTARRACRSSIRARRAPAPASVSPPSCTTCCARATSIRDDDEVSPRMLYEMARRYDEWPGEDYSGSSARGAMKGWHKHGVCSTHHWPYYDREPRSRTRALREALRGRVAPAARRVPAREPQGPRRDARRDRGGRHPLRDRRRSTRGGENVGTNGIIECDARLDDHRRPRVRDRRLRRGRLLDPELVGRTAGASDGFAQISYDDWLANGTDVWVARLGAPIDPARARSVSRSVGVASREARAATCSAISARTSSASATTACSRPTGPTAPPKTT